MDLVGDEDYFGRDGEVCLIRIIGAPVGNIQKSFLYSTRKPDLALLELKNDKLRRT